MSDRYKKTYRVLMIDQHFPDASFINFEKFSAPDQLSRCMKAGIDSLHLTGKCHHGYSYYNTRIGVKHPALGSRDMFGELLEECRKHDLEAIAYYCLIFEQLAVERHPEWSMITRQRRPMVWNRLMELNQDPVCHRWNMPCINTGYGQYCLDQLHEIACGYEVDGVFLDIFEMAFSSKLLCHCPACEALYRAEGLDLWDDRQLFDILVHKKKMWGEFLAKVRQALDAGRAGLSLSLNGHLLVAGWDSLQQVSWPYTEGGEHAYNAVINKNIGVGYPQCGIVGGQFAHDDWREEVVQIQTSTVLAHGSRCFYFFTMGRKPDFIFEQHKYDLLEKINRETAVKQAYVEEARHDPVVGVYYSEASKILHDIDPEKPLEWPQFGCIRFERGLGRLIDAVRAQNLPVEVLPDWLNTPEYLAAYQALIVSDLDCLSDAEIANFKTFVEGGGHLIVTGTSGLRDQRARDRADGPLFDLIGVQFEGWCKDYSAQGISAYLEAADHPAFARLRPVPYLVRGDWPRFTVTDAQIISRIMPPVAVETRANFIGWNPLPPAGQPSKYVGLCQVRRGRGTVTFCPIPLRGQLECGVLWPAELIRSLLASLKLKTAVRAKGPEGLEMTYYWQQDRLVIHLLNQTVRALSGTVLPLTGVRLAFHEPRAIASSVKTVWPVEQPMQATGKDGEWTVEVPPVEIHTILTVDLVPQPQAEEPAASDALLQAKPRKKVLTA